MWFIDLAIQRIVACLLLAFGVILLGLYSYQNLVIATWPAIDLPTIVLTAALPGASPETMASSVAAPLEKRLGRLSGVTEMTSSSSVGSTQITIQFGYDRDIDGASNDVQSAINAAIAELPKEMPQRPIYKKVNPSVAPIVLIAISSETLPLQEIYGYADTVVRQKLSEVDGVGSIALEGASRESIRVALDSEAIAMLGLTFEDIQAAIASSSVHRPIGSVDGSRLTASLGVNDQLLTAQDYKSVIVHTSDGAQLRLSDVSAVEEGVSDRRVDGEFNGKPAVFVFVAKKAGANIVETVQHVQAALPAIKRWLPASVNLSLVIDRANEIESTVADFQLLLLITTMLVIVLVFLFLRNLTATLIACASIPVSLCGTFSVLCVLGYSLDVVSLLALMVAVGFVVDDSVVVVESVFSFRTGHSATQAVTSAVRQVGFTIGAITLSLIAAFAPLFFFVGVIGIMLREFAVTLCSAILISGIVSVTLTPSLCAWCLRGERTRRSEVVSGNLRRVYLRSLKMALRHPGAVLLLTLGVTVATAVLFVKIPKGFIPTQDSGTIYGFTEGSPDVSFEAMVAQQQAITKRLLEDKDVSDVCMLVGGSGNPAGIRRARFFAVLKSSRSRDNVHVVIGRLRKSLSSIPSSTTYMVPIEDINVGAREGKGQYQYTIRGDSWRQLQKVSESTLARLRGLPALKDVGSDFETGSLQLNLSIDRDKAANLGVSPKALDEALFSAFGQRQIALLYSNVEQKPIIIELKPSANRGHNGLDRIYLKASSGLPIPLKSVSSAAEGPASTIVAHQGEFPAITITFNLADDVSLGNAVNQIEAEVRKVELGPDVRAGFEGKAGAFKTFSGSESYLLFGALLAVYVVLGILYESFIHPLTIISSLPPAGFGALMALWINHLDLSLIAFIGIILLVGIVKKNAILIVDFAIKEQNSGRDAESAVFQACGQRVRPIFMTNAIGVLTSLPLMFSTGFGSNMRQPLGVALAGGLVVCLILTLYSTPVIYIYLDRVRFLISRAMGRLSGRVMIVPHR